MKQQGVKFCLIIVLVLNISLTFAQRKYNNYDDIYTNRDLDIIDTVYLPIDKPCLLRVTVLCCVGDYQKVNNESYEKTTHPIYNPYSTLGDDSLAVSYCCWSPLFTRIVPLTTVVYLDSLKLEAVHDMIMLYDYDEPNIQLWEAVESSEEGKIIVSHMPLIEMYLWKKITDEVTLVCDNHSNVLYELITIQILPSGDNSCLSICKPPKKNHNVSHD